MPTTNYIWDEQNYLAEADGSDTVNVVYTNDPAQYGNLISTRISGTTIYHHFDAIGSTRQLTNSAGTVTDTMLYDAWGNVVNRTGTTGANLLWIGELGYYADVEVGQFYVRRRPYNPVIARWTAVDPLEFADSANRFSFVHNNPSNLADPSGLVWINCTCKCIPNLGSLLATALVTLPSFSSGINCLSSDWKACCNAACKSSSPLVLFCFGTSFTIGGPAPPGAPAFPPTPPMPPARPPGACPGCPVPWVSPPVAGVTFQYGCYCGKEPTPPRPLASIPQPIDAADTCCRAHDICCARASTVAAKTACNADLCQCAQNALAIGCPEGVPPTNVVCCANAARAIAGLYCGPFVGPLGGSALCPQ